MQNDSIKNYRNRHNGKSFETFIEDSLEYYKQLGIAVISKTPEPMRIIRNNGKGYFTCVFSKKAEPDFKGSLCDGTCIIFDAKHTEKEKILQSAVTDNQMEVFAEYEKMGAHCYIVISVMFNNFYRVPYQVWRDMKSMFGHKYMSKEDLEKYKVKFDGFVVRILDGIELRDE